MSSGSTRVGAGLTFVLVLLGSLAVSLGAGLAPGPTPAQAISAPTPLLYLDASNPASYPGTGTQWYDLSGANNHGTIFNVTNSVTFDPVTSSMRFPGGVNGSAYVSLSAQMNDFSNGITIEFEGEFGVDRTLWERIFDFAEGIGQTANAFWVGQFETSNELTVEIFKAGIRLGYCHTATGGNGLGPTGTRTFYKWLITIDTDPPNLCRIYRDGVEMPTRVLLPGSTFNNSTVSASVTGSAYSLPPSVSANVPVVRDSNFLGRSNFTNDHDLEGSIRYIRIYDQALTPQQALANATRTVTFDANGGSGSMANQSSTTSATLNANSFTRTNHTFAGWNTVSTGAGTPYADGATYPFVADSTLYAQWTAIASPALPPPFVVPPSSTTTTTSPPSTTTPPRPVLIDDERPPSFPPGDGQATEDGVAVPTRILVENDRNLVMTGPDFRLQISGECQVRCAVVDTDSGLPTIQLDANGQIFVEGTGFEPGTMADVWIFSTPTYLGSVEVAADGTFTGRFPLGSVAPGDHVVQVNGTTADGETRSANLGVVVRANVTLPVTGDAAWIVVIYVALLLSLIGAIFWLRSRPLVQPESGA